MNHNDNHEDHDDGNNNEKTPLLTITPPLKLIENYIHVPLQQTQQQSSSSPSSPSSHHASTSHHLTTSHHHSHHKKTKTNTVKSGYLKMRQTTLGFISIWRTYYFILKRSVLVYKNHKEDKRIAGIINLSKVSIWSAKEETGRATAFMVYHPLRENVLFLASSPDSMKSWMSAMQSVKEYLALYDKEEDYTSSDEEIVNCCGTSVRLPWLLRRRNNRLPPQMFDDVINNDQLSMNTPRTPLNQNATLAVASTVKQEKMDSSTKETLSIGSEDNVDENNNRKSEVNTTQSHAEQKPMSLEVICTYDASSNKRSDAEVVLDLTEEEKIQMIDSEVQKLIQNLSQELHLNLDVKFKAMEADVRDQALGQ